MIINDGSTDSTTDIIEEFTSDKRIQHVRLPENQGTGKALQDGIKHDRYPLFCHCRLR